MRLLSFFQRLWCVMPVFVCVYAQSALANTKAEPQPSHYTSFHSSKEAWSSLSSPQSLNEKLQVLADRFSEAYYSEDQLALLTTYAKANTAVSEHSTPLLKTLRSFGKNVSLAGVAAGFAGGSAIGSDPQNVIYNPLTMFIAGGSMYALGKSLELASNAFRNSQAQQEKLMEPFWRRLSENGFDVREKENSPWFKKIIQIQLENADCNSSLGGHLY